MKLKALYRAAVLRLMNVPFEKRPNEREAYLVTFEFEKPPAREGETAAIENTAQAKETSDSRTAHRIREWIPGKPDGERENRGAAVDLLKRVFPIDNPAGKTITLEKAIRCCLLE
jgi:hypothetical protein